jgi:hypothetical protein
MAGFTGRWALVSAENAEAYMTAIHAPDALKTKLLGLLPTLKTNPEAFVEEVTVNTVKGTVQVKIFMSGEPKHDVTFELNKEVDNTGLDGIPAKVKITLPNDTKLVMHKKTATYETEIVYNLSTSGTEVTTTRTSGGVTCIDKFKKV